MHFAIYALTANIIANEIGYAISEINTEKRIYLASVAELITILGGLDDTYNHTILVGHNPGLTELVNRLANNTSIENIPTCGPNTGWCWFLPGCSHQWSSAC